MAYLSSCVTDLFTHPLLPRLITIDSGLGLCDSGTGVLDIKSFQNQCTNLNNYSVMYHVEGFIYVYFFV